MNTMLKALCLAAAMLSAVNAAAEVYIHSEFKWQDVTFSTTGSLTFDIVPGDRESSFSPGWGFPTDINPDGTVFIAGDRQARTVNAPGENMSIEMLTNSTQHAMNASLYREFFVNLQGAGSVTFYIPYVSEWTTDGLGMGGSSLTLWGVDIGDSFYLATQNGGGYPSSGRSAGVYELTLGSYGGARQYQLHAYAMGRVAAIPEPETWALLGGGAAAMMLLRRRGGRHLSASHAV